MAETEIEVRKVRPEPSTSTAAITFTVVAFALFLGVVVWSAIKLGPKSPIAQTEQPVNPTPRSE
jgi:hypothetical protein